MSGMISVDRRALVSILGQLAGYPNPDDPGDPGDPLGPWGPWGPVIRADSGALYSERLAADMLHEVAVLNEVSEALEAGELREHLQRASRDRLARFVDDFCGTAWPRRPIPIPPPRDLPEQPGPADLVRAGLRLERASRLVEAGSLREDVAAAGAKLIEQGLSPG